MQAVIETEGLTKHFRSGRLRPRTVRAVDGVSLRVPEGAAYGLLGPNGSGKTTLLKMLLSVIHPTAGAARLFGTADGPIQGDPLEIERRMDLIAQILRHQDFEIASESRVPGRQALTTRIGVNLTIGNQMVPDVGFVAVRTDDGQWMVETIDIAAITNR